MIHGCFRPSSGLPFEAHAAEREQELPVVAGRFIDAWDIQ